MIEAARWKVMQLAFVREFHFEGNFDYLMYVKLVLVCFPPPPARPRVIVTFTTCF